MDNLIQRSPIARGVTAMKRWLWNTGPQHVGAVLLGYVGFLGFVTIAQVAAQPFCPT